MGFKYHFLKNIKYYFHLLSQYKEERVAKTYEQELNDIVERDPLAPLYEQDKTLIWRFRMYLLENLPSSLPKLLNSVKWYQHTDVTVVSIYMHTYMYMYIMYMHC